MVPPDVIEPVIKTLVNNFVTERNSSDVMAIGLNAVREICLRCPLAMTEDLLRDLTQYKLYKEKSVMMASKSLILLYREQMPTLLSKKDRGRPTEASVEIKAKKYGEVVALDHIPGTEALLTVAPELDVNESEDDEDSDGWEDVEHSGDEKEGIADKEKEKITDKGAEDDDDDEDEDDDDEDEDNDDEGEDEEESDDDSEESEKEESEKDPNVTTMNTKEAVQELALTKIFTDEDFARIEKEQIKKKITNNTRKRQLEKEKSEFVKLDDIEMIYKKRKMDKEARVESIKKGREGREKFGFKDNRKNPFSSKTNNEKRKTKNYNMIRHKARGKIKKSFREKQIKLRKHLVQQKKMK